MDLMKMAALLQNSKRGDSNIGSFHQPPSYPEWNSNRQVNMYNE